MKWNTPRVAGFLCLFPLRYKSFFRWLTHRIELIWKAYLFASFENYWPYISLGKLRNCHLELCLQAFVKEVNASVRSTSYFYKKTTSLLFLSIFWEHRYLPLKSKYSNLNTQKNKSQLIFIQINLCFHFKSFCSSNWFFDLEDEVSCLRKCSLVVQVQKAPA